AVSAGYLPTLIIGAQLDVDRQNVTALEEFLKIFQAFKEGGDLGQLQVDQLENQLIAGRVLVLQDEQRLHDALDQFKFQLGVPVDVPLELDDQPLKSITKQFKRFDAAIREFNEAQEVAGKFGAADKVDQLRGFLRKVFTSSEIVK